MIGETYHGARRAVTTIGLAAASLALAACASSGTATAERPTQGQEVATTAPAKPASSSPPAPTAKPGNTCTIQDVRGISVGSRKTIGLVKVLLKGSDDAPHNYLVRFGDNSGVQVFNHVWPDGAIGDTGSSTATHDYGVHYAQPHTITAAMIGAAGQKTPCTYEGRAGVVVSTTVYSDGSRFLAAQPAP